MPMTGTGPAYIGKIEIADMLGLSVRDFTKGLFVLSHLGFPDANQTSPGDPRWLREAVEIWRDAYWDRPEGDLRARAHDAKSGRLPRSPEKTAMMHHARQV